MSNASIVELSATASLPQPADPLAAAFRREVINALSIDDTCGLIAILLRTARELAPEERVDACWLPCLVGSDERDRAGRPLSAAAAIARFIRESARALIAVLPLAEQPLWLLPATTEDTTAVHLAALLLARCGRVARPWIWPFLPGSDQALIVGAVAMPVASTCRPRQLHRTTLLDLARLARADVAPVLAWAS